MNNLADRIIESKSNRSNTTTPLGQYIEDEEDEHDFWERDTWYTPTRDNTKFSKIPASMFAPTNRERREPIYIDEEVSAQKDDDDDDDKNSQTSAQTPDEYGYIRQSNGLWLNIHTKKITDYHVLDNEDS